MLTRLGRRGVSFCETQPPWTRVYGLARTIVALSTATTLAVNSSDTLFRPGSGIAEFPACGGVRGVALFCQAPQHLDWMRAIAVVGLLVVASGWRPRLTGLLHFWIAWSVQASMTVLEGGDHLASNLSLLLLPVALTDGRKWHWSAPPALQGDGDYAKAILALSSLFVVRLQMCCVYFEAAVGKYAAPEWVDGTALYYWLTHPVFGSVPSIKGLLWPLLTNGFTVTAATWGVVLLEFYLAAAILLAPSRTRLPFALGVALHLGILVAQGLLTFSCVMVAALILYLAPRGPNMWFERLLSGLGDRLTRLVASAQRSVHAADRSGAATRAHVPEAGEAASS